MVILNWLVNNIFTQTSIIIGALALVGLIALKKQFSDVLQGFLKTVLGYYIFMSGILTFVGVMNYFQEMITVAFNVPAVKMTTDYMMNYGKYYAPVIFGGLVLHLLIERFILPKKYRFVYLGGGHFLLRYSMLTTGIAVIVFGVKNFWPVFLFGTIITGIWYSVQPIYIDKYLQKVRGDNLLGYGHSSSSAAFITSFIASKIGKAEVNAEEIKFPKGINFMRDLGVAMAIVQAIIMFTVGVIVGPEVVRKVAGLPVSGLDPYMWLIIQSITFSAGFQVLTFGLRTMVGELLPAFSGIADKIIPGARPAMDVPTIFPFGQNSVVIGSTVCILTFFVYMVIFNSMGWGIPFPFVPCLFMSGAGAAVYGNKMGGVRGAVIGGIVVATMIAFGTKLVWILGYPLGAMEYQVMYIEPDGYFILWPLTWALGRLFFGAPV